MSSESKKHKKAQKYSAKMQNRTSPDQHMYLHWCTDTDWVIRTFFPQIKLIVWKQVMSH